MHIGSVRAALSDVPTLEVIMYGVRICMRYCEMTHSSVKNATEFLKSPGDTGKIEASDVSNLLTL